MQTGLAVLEAPFGSVRVLMEEGKLVRVVVIDQEWEDVFMNWPGTLQEDELMCKKAVQEISEYLRGTRKIFSLPLQFHGTAFQEKVWRAMQSIPYGLTRGYGEIAQLIGIPRGARAVGQASRLNPLPLVIPCHRVVGCRGELVGYGGNHTGIKAWLLDHERTVHEKEGH